MRRLAAQQSESADDPRVREMWVVSTGDPHPRLMRFVDGVSTGRGFATQAEADADVERNRRIAENLKRASQKRR